MPLTPAVFHILLALHGGARHGYAIMGDVAETSGLSMGPGTVYGTLQRLEEAGHVEEAPRPANELDERRRYWQLTAAGLRALEEESQRVAGLAELLRRRRLAPTEGA